MSLFFAGMLAVLGVLAFIVWIACWYGVAIYLGGCTISYAPEDEEELAPCRCKHHEN